MIQDKQPQSVIQKDTTPCVLNGQWLVQQCLQHFHRNWVKKWCIINVAAGHGIQPACFFEDVKEMVLDSYNKKDSQSFLSHQGTQYSLIQFNQEDNWGAQEWTKRKMIKSKPPKWLWDDCMQLESGMRSNIAHDILTLNGEVTKMVQSRYTSEICQFCEFEWFKRVMYKDEEMAPSPVDVLKPVRYLGPSVAVGLAMMVKMLIANNEVLHWWTHPTFTHNV